MTGKEKNLFNRMGFPGQLGKLGDVIAAIDMAVKAEAEAREAAVKELRQSIEDEKTVREAADTALQQDITAEAEAREAADTAIEGRFPVQTSDIADGAVTQEKLSAEVAALSSAVQDLSAKVDALKSAAGA